MHMREQYILQPTESSSGTGNPGPLRQRMTAWSGDTRAASSMIQDLSNPFILIYYLSTWLSNNPLILIYIKRPQKQPRSSTPYLGYSAVLNVLLTIIVIEHIPKVHISVQIVDNLCTYYRLRISNFGDLSNSETGQSFLPVNHHFRCTVSILGASISVQYCAF